MPREKTFRFKQFSVLNDKTAMKVGTDGVLLGAWCDVTTVSNVLDVGTGCGLIALMIAQRNNHALIHGIDIDENAIDEAQINFANSPWAPRLTASVADFNNFENNGDKYDLIVSNPPFFTNGILPPSNARNQARHTTSLSYESLLSRSRHLLSNHGTIAIITPSNQETTIRRCLIALNLGLKRFTQVIPIEGAAPKRLLWEITLDEVSTITTTLTIAMNDRSPSNDYSTLTRDFYLD